MNSKLLGGLAPRTFLQRHWQKRPLFVPSALAPAPDLIDERALTALARRDDVESRMVERRGNRLVFEVSAHDGTDEVLRGTHTRAVVLRSKFLDRLASKAA